MKARLRLFLGTLGNGRLRLLAGGQLVSYAGVGMHQVVVMWHMYELTDSVVSVGLTGLMRAVPMITFSLIGGVAADVIDRRRLLYATQLVMFMGTSALLLVTVTGVVAPWMIYVVTFLIGAANAFDFPARQALIPTVASPTPLNQAINLLLIVRRSANIGGPALGGVLIAWVGIAAAYGVVASTCIVLIAALYALRVTLPPTGARFAPKALAEGVRFVRATPILSAVLITQATVFLFVNTSSVWPAYARDIFEAGPHGLGVLGAAMAVGNVIALMTVLTMGDISRKGRVVIGCAFCAGLSVLAFGLSPVFIVAALALAVFGFLDAVGDSMRHTLVLTLAPDHLRGRVSSVASAMASGGWSLGQVSVGLIAATVGLREGVMLCGLVVMLGAALLFLMNRTLVSYQEPAQVGTGP